MTDRGELTRLRAEVDRIDLQLVELMAARQTLVQAIAGVKGDPARVRDPRREEAILARVGRASIGAGLSLDIALPVWRRLLEVSVEYERALLTGGGGPVREGGCCGCRGPGS